MKQTCSIRWICGLLGASLLLSCSVNFNSFTSAAEEHAQRQAVKIDAAIYDSYVGQYELAPKVLLTLRRERRHFFAQLTGQPEVEVFPESETKFFWKVVNAQFTIKKDDTGKVSGLFLEQGAAKLNAKKISNELLKGMELPEPEDTIESPRLATLARELKNGNQVALSKFWDDLQDNGPLVEQIGGGSRNSWVTFVWRGDGMTRRVYLDGGLPTKDNKKWLTRLAETDLWYRTERIPNDARFAYHFQVNLPLKLPRSGDFAAALKIMEHCPPRLDPFNPLEARLQGMLCSVAELAEAPLQPWITLLPDVPQGELKDHTIKSEQLKGERNVTVYTPADYDPQGSECGLLVLFDGAFYQDPDMIPGPVILDNLIAKRKIPPLVAVFVKHNPVSRNQDLSCSQPFADFVAKELVPWVRTEYRVSPDPARATVGGLSLGGLMASYCGLRHSSVFGNVLSQSGSYWWYPDGLKHDDRELPTAEPGWLTRQYVTESTQPLRFYIEAGRFEDGGTLMGGLSETRRFRDVLQARGYTVHYSQFTGGHDFLSWRGSLADGLMALTSNIRER